MDARHSGVDGSAVHPLLSLGICYARAAAIDRRIIVIGARGFFGALAANRLRAEGLAPIPTSRRPGAPGFQLDAGDRESISRSLRQEDIVLDAAGPFQSRNTALVEEAIEVGFDLVDLSDSLGYAARVLALRDQIDRSGVRVLTSCSAVSAVSAALVRLSGVPEPVGVSIFLAPASRATANPATIRSFLASVGKPVMAWRDGRLSAMTGWQQSRAFRWPGTRKFRGYLTESADTMLLPPIWPSLRCVDFWVDTQIPGLNALLSASARFSPVAQAVRRLSSIGSALARRVGAVAGAFGVEVEGAEGSRVSVILGGPSQSYLIAFAPAVLAVRELSAGRFPHRGLVRADRQTDPQGLVDYLAAAGISLQRSPAP